MFVYVFECLLFKIAQYLQMNYLFTWIFHIFEIWTIMKLEICTYVNCQNHCILDRRHPTRIYPSQPFLGRSCQNELMRSNNFDINFPGSLHTEVEALAKNYYSFKQIFKKNCVVNCYENTDFQNLWLFWLRSFFGPFLRFHGLKNSWI